MALYRECERVGKCMRDRGRENQDELYEEEEEEGVAALLERARFAAVAGQSDE